MVMWCRPSSNIEHSKKRKRSWKEFEEHRACRVQGARLLSTKVVKKER